MVTLGNFSALHWIWLGLSHILCPACLILSYVSLSPPGVPSVGKLVSYHGDHLQGVHVTVTGDSADTHSTGVGYVVKSYNIELNMSSVYNMNNSYLV